MKKLKKLILLFLIIFLLFPKEAVCAINNTVTQINNNTVQLRAGGGSSGGSSGGGSSSSSSSSNHYYRNNSPHGVISTIISWILFIIAGSGTAIIFIIKINKASFHSKQLLKILDNKDDAWKYQNIEKQVIETFYIVQKSWTNMNMYPAKNHMSNDLYDKFKTKLEWMQVSNKRNILKKIKLLNIKPISIHDDEDDSKDIIWFYIKGKMIDYIINTKTNEKLEGNEFSKTFIEFWQFLRKENNKWVLSKILQKDESDKIVFQGQDKN